MWNPCKTCYFAIAHAYSAAFSTVLVPKDCVIANRSLSILQKFLYLCIATAVGYLVVTNPSQYLQISVPDAFASVQVSAGAGYGAAVASEFSSGEHCQSGVNNKFAFLSADDGIETDGIGRWSDFTCLDPNDMFDFEGDGDFDRQSAFIPLAMNDNIQTVMSGSSCGVGNALESVCASSNTAQEFVDKEPGAQKYYESDAGTECWCTEVPKSYFATGVGKKQVGIDHAVTVETSTLKQMTVFAGFPDSVNAAANPTLDVGQWMKGVEPRMLTKVMSYNGQKWAEADCASATNRQDGGTCRFGDGKVPQMTVEDWLKVAGVSDLDSVNEFAGMGENAAVSSSHKGQQLIDARSPTFRVSGLEIVVAVEYVGPEFHSEMDWQNPATGRKQKFPGVLCHMKVTAVKNSTLRRTLNWITMPTAADHVSGKLRRRWQTGVAFRVHKSEDSELGFFAIVGLLSYLAVTVVYFQFATLAVMYLALYTLGNTSRNYARVIREHINVATQSAKRTPAKCIIAAAAYFLMREWEHDQKGMHHFLDDDTTIHKSTIRKFMITAYNPALLADIEEAEVDDMAAACFDELTGGGEREGVTLMEFLDADLSSEAVDYFSCKTAFNKERKKTCMERLFGDNVAHYSQKEKKMCFGLLPNAASLTERSDNKARKAFQAGLAANLESARLAGKMGGAFARGTMGGLGKVGARSMETAAKLEKLGEGLVGGVAKLGFGSAKLGIGGITRMGSAAFGRSGEKKNKKSKGQRSQHVAAGEKISLV